MGYGYWMVHGLDNGTTDIYQMTESVMDKSVKIGNITIQYGGVNGKGKRVNILCESNKYKFTFCGLFFRIFRVLFFFAQPCLIINLWL